MLEKIKIRLGITDNERNLLINDLIDDTKEDIKSYINTDDLEITPGIERIIKELVILKFNRLGAEGITSENIEGVQQSYIDGLPNDLKKKLNRLRKLPR